MTYRMRGWFIATVVFFVARLAAAAHVEDWNDDGNIVIGCLGDSNTSNLAQGQTSWCPQLGTLFAQAGLTWQVRNMGIPGATVIDPNPGASSGWTSTALQQLVDSASGGPAPDVLVLAFGTNDLGFGSSVNDTVTAYSFMKSVIEFLGGRALVALTPPVQPFVAGQYPGIDALNDALRTAFPADEVIDFHSIMDLSTDYLDFIHMNNAGQTKRAAAAYQALAPPFFVQDLREVCQFPRPDNNGKVMGHDNGASVLFNGKSYWFFADTRWDSNNNGFYDTSDGFIGRGTVAYTTDLDASDCMDMTYSVVSGHAKEVFPASAQQADECLLWPAGPVVANGSIYLYSTAVKKTGSTCGTGHEVFLSKFNTSTLQAQRLVTTQSNSQPQFSFPFNVAEAVGCEVPIKWVYLLGSKSVEAGLIDDTAYLLGRVTETNIENPSTYQYWNGSTWIVGDPTAATALFQENAGGQSSISYNSALDRYMIVYTCDLSKKVCARTALAPGAGPEALLGGWSERVDVYECPGEFFSCYFGYSHPEFGDGSTIYVSADRLTPQTIKPCDEDSDCACPNDPNPANQCVSGACTAPNVPPRYRLRLREVKVGTIAGPAGRSFHDAGRDYTPEWSYPRSFFGSPVCDEPIQGANGWSYRRLSGTALTDLTYNYLWNWRGPDTVGGALQIPAPQINEDTSLPGENTDAVRVWAAPGAGTVQISGEVRKHQACGDQAIAKLLRIQGSSTVGAPLWSATLGPSSRSVLLNWTGTVNAGDSIGMAVARGGTSAGCDEVIFAPTITYTP